LYYVITGAPILDCNQDQVLTVSPSTDDTAPRTTESSDT